jgi:hypothetical protein
VLKMLRQENETVSARAAWTIKNKTTIGKNGQLHISQSKERTSTHTKKWVKIVQVQYRMIDTKIRRPQQWPRQGCDGPTRIHTLRKYVGQADAVDLATVRAKQ